MRSSLAAFGSSAAFLLCAAFSPVCLLSQTPNQSLTYPQPTVLPTGSWPLAVYAADVNGDGKADLLYVTPATRTSEALTHILLNNGDGTFKAMPSIAMRGTSIAIGDFFGTGKLGLAAVLPSTAAAACPGGMEVVSVQGKGDGTFFDPFGKVFCPALLGTGKAALPGNAASARLAPGGPDLFLFTDAANGLLYAVNLQQSAGTTSLLYSVNSMPDGAGPVFSADVDGDGNLDVVVNGQAAFGIDTFLGDGKGALKLTSNGTFARSLLLESSSGTARVQAEDGRGKIASYTWGGLQFLADSMPATSGGASGNGGHLIAHVDLNHDGLPDLLTATPAGISVLLGDANGYSLQGIYNAGPGHSSYAVADFNGDGNLDLALDSPEGVAILYGNRDGSFQTSLAYATGKPAMSGALGKFSAQSPFGVVVATGPTQAQLLTSPAAGEPLTLVASPTGSDPGQPGLVAIVQAADFNQDGIDDILLTADGPTSALPATGSGATIQFGSVGGTFTAPAPLMAPAFSFPSPASCHPAFDHFPGTLYGVSAVFYPYIVNLDAGAYRVFNGATNGNTAPPLLWSESDDTSLPGDNNVDCDLDAHNRPIVGDFHGTGQPDIFFQDEGQLTLYSNDGKGHFSTPPPDQNTGRMPADLSNPVSTLITRGQLPAPRLNKTFNAFDPKDTFPYPAFLGSAAVADLDGDGNNDLLATYADLAADRTAPDPAAPNYLYIWFGSGNGKFLTSARHPVNPVRIQLSRNYYDVVSVDLTGDGIPDLLLSDGYLLDVQVGLGDGTFGPEQHVLAGQGINTVMPAKNVRSAGGAASLYVANGGQVLTNPVANLDALGVNPDVDTGAVTLLVALPSSTPTGTLSASPNPSAFEGAFTLTATSPNFTMGGSVVFSVDGTTLGTGPVQGATATYTVPADPLSALGKPLLPGGHTLRAAFTPTGGAAGFLLQGAHTVSLAPTSVVLKPTTPLLTFYGGPANGTFVVTVIDPGNYPATSTWTQLSNGAPVAGCIGLPLTSQCPYGAPDLLPVGSYAFAILYNGDPVNAPATSPDVVYVVQPDTTTATLTSSSNPATLGSAVTFRAKLSGNLAVPTGLVQFLDSGNLIGTGAPDSAGAATLTTSSLTAGTHPITARYAATQNFNAANSSMLEQVILVPTVAAAFTLTVAPSAVAVEAGHAAIFQVTVTETSSFTLPIALTCSGLPREAACLFVQSAAPPGGAITTLQVLTSAPHACGTTQRVYSQQGPTQSTLGCQHATPGVLQSPALRGLELGAPTLAALLLLWPRRRRRLPSLLLALVALISLGAANGCGGNCTDLGTLPGSYTFSVIATPAGGSISLQAVAATINVSP